MLAACPQQLLTINHHAAPLSDPRAAGSGLSYLLTDPTPERKFEDVPEDQH